MEILLSKADLVRELYFLQGVVERKSSIPILSNVLLEAQQDCLRFSATDLDISLQSDCAAQVVKEGAVTVNAKKIYEVARSLPESEVHLTVLSGNWVQIECAHAVFKLAGLPRDDYPVLPQRPSGAEVQIDGEALRDLTTRTAFAITGEDARYFLLGALMVIEGGAVAFVATDGHRLSYARRPGACEGNAEKRVLVPRKAVNELARLLEEGGPVRFGEGGNHLLFTAGRRTLGSKMVEGQFPSFENVVSMQGDKTVKISREELLAGIRRVSLVASERTRSVKLTLTKGQLVLVASSSDLGEARESLGVEYEGADVTIGFNAQYLQEFLAVAGSEHVSVELKNADSQGIFRPVGDLKTDHRYVVMPMRL